MAKWPDTPVYTPITNINKGNEYQEADGLIAADINAIVKNIAYLYGLKDNFVQDPFPGKNDTGADLTIIKNIETSKWGTAFKRNSAALAQNANAFDFVGYGDSGEIYAKTTTDSDYSVVNKKYIYDNFIPVKDFASGPFQIPQIGYNKELNWIDCNTSISPLSLTQRDSNGIIYINPPDTVPENINEYAGVNVQYANKTYVKAIYVTENTYVYAASSEGPNGRLRVSTVADNGTIAQRDTNGNIKVGTAVDNDDTINKQYLEANALTANNVKTLFGNQSIIGSGNIDLYFHSIQINGYRGAAQNEIIIRFNIISSNNLNCDSLTDLDTILGTSIALSVSGFSKEAGVTTGIWGLTGTKISSAAVNLIGGGHFSISSMQNINITDDVKTV